ncbi:MAG: conjugal transfer protein TraF [Arsenophonus sp.]|nr:conjugal transfer protein TraF [Arsenophonus sp.]
MKTLFAFFVLLFVIPVNAGVIDEIAALEKHKTAAGNNPTQQGAASKAKPQIFRLSTGQVLNITDWQIVHFMKSDCHYCQQFNPILNATAQQRGIPVFVYSFDGLGDSTFNNVLPVIPAVIEEFFPELPQVTPTDFIVNTQTLVAIPVS